MDKFGIYFIPSVERSDFYNLGSKIVGYDIQNEKNIIKDDRNLLFDQKWNSDCMEYGFHLTIGDAIYFETDKIQMISKEVQAILDVLDVNKLFELKPNKKFLEWRGPNENILVLSYNANLYLQIFHTLVVSLIHPLGNGSLYTERKKENPLKYAQEPFLNNRVDRFFTYSGLDNYQPHFTLLNPFVGSKSEKSNLYSSIDQLFSEYKSSVFEVSKLALVVKKSNENFFKIIKIFSR